MKKSKIEIVYRNTDEIYELMNNPRKITREQMEKLEQSIKDNPDYFEARPIILSDRTGKMVIIAGNQRVRAAAAIGMTEVPTVLLSGLSEEREREIIIRDNVSNGDWDYDVLASDWAVEDLQEWGVNITSWSEDEINNFFEGSECTKDEKAEEKYLKCPKCGYEFEK